jgi:hypothetical protein
MHAPVPNLRAPAHDARASAGERTAEESLCAHAWRLLRTRASNAATAVLDPGIAWLQRLRKAAGGAQGADGGSGEDRRRPRDDGANDRPGGRRDAAAPAAQGAAPAPKPTRRLRAFLIYLSVLLAGGMGGGALAFNLFAKLLDRQSAESRRLQATLSKNAKSAAAAKKELELAQSKRIEAEKKLEASIAEHAKSSPEKQTKLDEAEHRPATMLAAERARDSRQPSAVSRDSAGGKALPVKTGNCKVDGNNSSALKDCINEFNRKGNP